MVARVSPYKWEAGPVAPSSVNVMRTYYSVTVEVTNQSLLARWESFREAIAFKDTSPYFCSLRGLLYVPVLVAECVPAQEVEAEKRFQEAFQCAQQQIAERNLPYVRFRGLYLEDSMGCGEMLHVRCLQSDAVIAMTRGVKNALEGVEGVTTKRVFPKVPLLDTNLAGGGEMPRWLGSIIEAYEEEAWGKQFIWRLHLMKKRGEEDWKPVTLDMR